MSTDAFGEYSFTFENTGFFQDERVVVRLSKDGNEYITMTVRNDGFILDQGHITGAKKRAFAYLLCAVIQQIVWQVEPTLSGTERFLINEYLSNEFGE